MKEDVFMMIQRIANLDPDTYYFFCKWLRDEKGIIIGELIKESGVTQDRMLTAFILSRREAN